MKKHGLIVWTPVALVIAVAAMAVAMKALSKEERVSPNDVPQVVMRAIEQQAMGGTIVEIERETRGDTVFYEAEVKKDGRVFDVAVSESGELLGTDDEGKKEDDDEGEVDDEGDDEGAIELSEAPRAVQRAIRNIVADNPIQQIEKETEEGVTTYEVEFLVDQVKYSARMTEQGEVMELEHEVSAEALPQAAARAIQKEFPRGTVKSIEAVQLFFYEVEITTANGKTREVTVFASGDIEDEDDDEGAIEDDDDDDDDDDGEVDDDDDDDDDDGKVDDDDDDEDEDEDDD